MGVITCESTNSDALSCAPLAGIIGYYLTRTTCTYYTTIIGVASCDAATEDVLTCVAKSFW